MQGYRCDMMASCLDDVRSATNVSVNLDDKRAPTYSSTTSSAVSIGRSTGSVKQGGSDKVSLRKRSSVSKSNKISEEVS